MTIAIFHFGAAPRVVRIPEYSWRSVGLCTLPLPDSGSGVVLISIERGTL
jgi:hypothetical protein